MSTQIVFASKNPPIGTQFSSESELGHMIAAQKEYFLSDVTKKVDFRVQQLKRLKKLIRQHEQALLEALHKDLGKAPMEGYLTEIMLVINEINYSIKKLKSWAKPKYIENNFFLSPATSKIYYEPFGVCLIIAPWNYPILLSLRPLISAICGGNCVTLKCSEQAPNVNSVILEMINQHFPTEYICAIDCGPHETEKLTSSGYDFIFYTGNANTGKAIMKTAADSITPVVLELGGKSPCIVDESADVTLAAKRLVWGKFMNAGQTCVAPDYVYVHISRKSELIKALENQIVKVYGKDPINNPDFGKIINPQKFQRLIDLLSEAKIIWGGNYDEEKLKIEPTLVEVDSFNEKLMKEEIFGPILPILVYKDLDILISNLKKLPKSLALYQFSKDKEPLQKINKSISFGGGCVNDCVMQITNKFLPFGGVGQSGFGSYVGEEGFKTFSHAKSIVERKRFMLFDFLPVMPPYTESKFKLLKILAKLFGY
ncbi:MAG: aldehyde dehydrogenase family protein [Proteobacteria bacterium]|nr:aldehyde dehydrogenase family protein [Pseudomonadota bacterium]